MLLLSRHLPSTRTLQCYLAVAQELNFRRAAELLHMSQPPLSRQIQALEDMLRVKLIERDTHRVSLTAAGEAFKQHAFALLQALDLAVTHARSQGNADADTVRIGLTRVIEHPLIAALTNLLADPVPGVPALERAWSRHLVERVRGGALDIAIVGDIVAPAADLTVARLGSEALLAVLPATHPAAALAEVDLAALSGTPLFLSSRTDNPAFYDKCERAFKRFGFAASRRPEPKDFTQLLAAVAAGEGIALCPQSMQATSRSGVVYRPLLPAQARWLAIDVQLVTRADEARPAVLAKVGAIEDLFGAAAPHQASMPAMPSGA